MKILNSNDIRDVAENLNDSMLKAVNETTVYDIVGHYNIEQARRVAELEELSVQIVIRKLCKSYNDGDTATRDYG